jgi:hypothetical protein
MKQCRYCPRNTFISNEAAWGSGWRWFTGTTQDGRPYDDAACPHCAGQESATSLARSWDVECRGCTWGFKVDDFMDGDELLITALDAIAVAREHRCEPDLWLTDPDDNMRRLEDFDRDGNLKKKG